MAVKENPHVLMREIELRDVKMSVFFWYYQGHEASESDPGCPAEIEIESVFVDDFNCLALFGERTLDEIEGKLWAMLDNKGTQ